MARSALRSAGDEPTLLLEREEELAIFEAALGRLPGGVGSLLVIEGAAGMGKTRLLSEAAELAGRAECFVRSARAGQLEREMPYAVVRQLLEGVIERSSEADRAKLLAGSAGLALSALGREVPERPNPERDPFGPIHGLYWLISNLAHQRPLVLLIDDAQWSDLQTLRWLEYLARRLGDVAVLVIAGVRSGEPDEPSELESLRLEAEMLHLAPLSLQAVERLISGQSSSSAPEFSSACAEASGGNPFLLTEVLRALRADGIEPDEAAAQSIATLRPRSIARHVLMRLVRFGDEAIALAHAVAVLDAAPQLSHAARLAGLEEQAALRLCDRLRDAEILAPGLPIEFVHPLVRSAIYSELAEGERSTAHRRAAQLLADFGVSPDRVASHLMASSPSGDQWVVARLREAAKQAMTAGAPEAAAHYLQRALDEPPDDELAVMHALGVALRGADPARAPEVLVRVAERTEDPGLRRAAMLDAARAHFDVGDLVEAARWLTLLIEAVPYAEERLPLEALRSGLRSLASGGDALSSEGVRDAAPEVDAHSDGGRLIRIAAGWEHFVACDPVEEVVALARSIPASPWDVKTVPIMGCKLLAWCGRTGDAHDAMAAQLDSARGNGLMLDTSYCHGFLSEIDRLGGRLSDSEAEARIAWDIASELAPMSMPAWGGLINLIDSLVARGEIGPAGELAERVPYFAKLSEVPMTPVPIEVRGRLRLAQGALDDGVADLLGLGEDLEGLQVLNPALSPWRQEAAPALAALGRTEEAERLIAEGERRARQFGAPHVVATMLRARAQLEPRKRQIATLGESVALLEQSGPSHELARSLVDLGSAMRRDKQRSDSREPLLRGLELAARSGADGLARRAREELAAAGSRPRSVFRTGVESLTASELRVAKLAAEGLRNVEIAQRLFVSCKTVEKHLGNVYTKLEIGGRGELAGALDHAGDASGP